MSTQWWEADIISGTDYWTRRGRTNKAEGTSPGGGPPPPGGEPAIWSELIAQSFGINTHYSFSPTVYGNDFAVTGLITDLGVRFIRDKIVQDNNAQELRFPQLAAAGVKVHSTIGQLGGSDPTPTSTCNYVNSHYGSDADSIFRSFGGCNEPNASGRPGNWDTQTKALQQELYEKVQATSNLNSIPVTGPSLHDQVNSLQQDNINLGNTGIKNYMDFGDFHHYQGGGLPTNLLNGRINWLQTQIGNTKKWTSTEGGYNNGVGITGHGNPVPNDVSAKYMPRLVMEHHLAGTVCFWRYELLDDPDPGGNTDWEAHFGIVATPSQDADTWNVKEEYTTMKRFLNLVGDPGPTYTPAPLHIDVSVPDSDSKWVLTGKRDGTYLLLVWRDVKLYDNHGYLTPASKNVQLAFSGSTPIKVYRPYQSASPEFTGNVSNHTLSVGGQLFAVEIG